MHKIKNHDSLNYFLRKNNFDDLDDLHGGVDVLLHESFKGQELQTWSRFKDEIYLQTRMLFGQCVAGIVLEYASCIGDYAISLHAKHAKIFRVVEDQWNSLNDDIELHVVYGGGRSDFCSFLKDFGPAQTIAKSFHCIRGKEGIVRPYFELDYVSKEKAQKMLVFLIRVFCLQFGELGLSFVLCCCSDTCIQIISSEWCNEMALTAINVSLEALNLVPSRCEEVRAYCECWNYGHDVALKNANDPKYKKVKISEEYRRKLRKRKL